MPSFLSPDDWWQAVYDSIEHIHVTYQIDWKDTTIKPGTLVKIKNQYEVFTFRCLAHNAHMDVTWIDCLDSSGTYCSFPIRHLRGPIILKKSRRKKANVRD